MSSQPVAPTVVGDYTLLTKIGEGGMGVVHLARRGSDGQRVALKLLRPHIVGDDEARRRLAREVSSLERVRSRWIAEIIDADPWAEIPFVATRYVPGLSLHDHVHSEGRIEGHDLLWFAAGLAEGIAAVHAAGVMHRDIKPSNVLMEGRAPILIDFGLARVADDPKLTHTGWLLGTPGYLAPEILYGDDASPASDVHSWAATVAFAGTGQAPFGRGPSMAIMDRVRRGEFKLAGLEGPLRDVVAAALDPEPDRRPTLESILAWLRPQTTRPTPLLAAPPETVPASTPLPPLMAGDDFDLPLAIAASAHSTPSTPATPAAPEASPEDPDAVLTRREPTPTSPRPTAPTPTLVERIPASPPLLQPLPIQPAPGPRPAPQPYQPNQQPHHQLLYQPAPDPWAWSQPAPRASLAERSRRAALLTALALMAGALLTVLPWVMLIVLGLLVWLLRSGSLAAEDVGARRAVRGRQWYDGVLLLVHAPWRVVQAVPGTLVLLLWSAGITAAAALVCYAASASVVLSLFVCAMALVVALWWGPGGRRVRSPLGRLVNPTSRTNGWWLLATGTALVVAVAAGVVAEVHGPSWAPSHHRFLERTVH